MSDTQRLPVTGERASQNKGDVIIHTTCASIINESNVTTQAMTQSNTGEYESCHRSQYTVSTDRSLFPLFLITYFLNDFLS